MHVAHQGGLYFAPSFPDPDPWLGIRKRFRDQQHLLASQIRLG
jgi:hypothetical protein